MDLVDTDVLIDIQRGHPPAIAWFSGLAELPGVPEFVVMEIIQDARDARELSQSLKLVAPLRLVWPTEADCARAPSDFTAYHLAQGLGLLDSLIASCAVGLSVTLYTFNLKHFRMVPGLVAAEPYVR
jgi:predicted nucleic acid-binding protein